MFIRERNQIPWCQPMSSAPTGSSRRRNSARRLNWRERQVTRQVIFFSLQCLLKFVHVSEASQAVCQKQHPPKSPFPRGTFVYFLHGEGKLLHTRAIIRGSKVTTVPQTETSCRPKSEPLGTSNFPPPKFRGHQVHRGIPLVFAQILCLAQRDWKDPAHTLLR